MADQFQASGNCGSGSSWWSTAARAGGFHGLTMPASISCSPELANIGGNFNWDMFEAKSRSCDESPAGSISNSSLTFQDIQDSHVSAPMMMAAQAMDFGLSSPTIEWSQPFFSSSGRTENSFHALLQEDVISRPYVQQTSGIECNHVYKDIENSFSSPLKDVNRSSLQDEHVLSSNASGIPHLASSCRLPPMLLQGLLEPDNRLQRSCYKPSIDYHEQMNESLLQSSLPKSPQFVKASPPNQQLQFSNNTPFWNPTASSVTQAHSIFHHARPPQLVQNQNSSFSNLIVKNTPGIQGSCSAMEKSGSDPAFKKPRIETLSPLPTFKVRKEKLGDRVTALQQLVSPFGKTDTASVLHEAIEYIKFLHEQVRVLSAPYLKNGHQVQQTKDLDKSKDSEGQNQDLRSQGLCLVPISSTFPVANEIPTDFWAPTFIGTFR